MDRSGMAEKYLEFLGYYSWDRTMERALMGRILALKQNYDINERTFNGIWTLEIGQTLTHIIYTSYY